MDMQSAIRAVTEKQDLDTAQMTAVMRLIMSGQATPAQIGGFLIGLRMKGETVSEITAAAKVMRELAIHVDVTEPHLVDTCGTGGDGVGTFNISTAAAFVVAAAGGKVAKHGNRSVSSKSGSADVLELAGVNLALTPAQVAQCIEQVGVGFLFAPQHHSAMKHAIGPRREMGVRTLFNLLGPLTNPAGALHQVMGVFSQQWLQALAEVFAQLGSRHVLVVHADDGMDEISIGSATQVAELNQGQITRYSITPEQFGMTRGDVKALAVSNAGQSLEIIHKVLKGEPSTAADIVALNAGAAIYAADIEASLEAGVKRAQHVLSSGTAFAKLNDLLDLTQSFQT